MGSCILYIYLLKRRKCLNVSEMGAEITLTNLLSPTPSIFLAPPFGAIRIRDTDKFYREVHVEMRANFDTWCTNSL